MIVEKVNTKEFQSILKNSSDDMFVYPVKYKLKMPLLHCCKYCKKISITGEWSLFDEEAVYICKRCGGRHLCSTQKIKLQKNTVAVLVAACLAFVCILAAFNLSTSNSDNYIPALVEDEHKETTSEQISEEDSMWSDTTQEETNPTTQSCNGFLVEGYNSMSHNSSESELYLFKPIQSGYYVFESTNSDEEDIMGSIIINDSVVCENDDFGGTRNFHMLYYCDANKEIYLQLEPYSGFIPTAYITIYRVSDTYAQGFEMFQDYKENGIYLTQDDTLYETYADFSSDTAYFVNGGTKTVFDYDIDESEGILWVGLESSRDEEEMVVWYPIYID